VRWQAVEKKEEEKEFVPGKFSGKKTKAQQKSGGAKAQWDIMRMLNIPDEARRPRSSPCSATPSSTSDHQRGLSLSLLLPPHPKPTLGPVPPCDSATVLIPVRCVQEIQELQEPEKWLEYFPPPAKAPRCPLHWPVSG